MFAEISVNVDMNTFPFKRIWLSDAFYLRLDKKRFLLHRSPLLIRIVTLITLIWNYLLYFEQLELQFFKVNLLRKCYHNLPNADSGCFFFPYRLSRDCPGQTSHSFCIIYWTSCPCRQNRWQWQRPHHEVRERESNLWYFILPNPFLLIEIGCIEKRTPSSQKEYVIAKKGLYIQSIFSIIFRWFCKFFAFIT